MIIIAESGSTKTEWRVIEGDKIHAIRGKGINPNTMSQEDCLKSIEACFNSQHYIATKELHYYGAGINAQTKADWLQQLRNLFIHAHIQVHNDLLAAGRACLGKQAGYVGILGTGTNLGYYDGSTFINCIPSMGYILGDEGAGVSIGKQVLKGYYRGAWPDRLKQAFNKKYPFSSDEMMSQLYQSSEKAAFLAQFAKWAFQHRKQPCIQQLISEVYSEYFNMINEVYDQSITELNLVGSIAYYWSDFIKKIAAQYHINIGQVLESPIAALTLYHQEFQLPNSEK